MSLTSALYTSFYGLRNTEAALSVTSANVTNADKPGYTRKEYAVDYVTTNIGTVPIGGTIQSVVLDPYLLADIIEDTSKGQRSAILAAYLSDYVDRLGSPLGGNTLSGSLDELLASFDEIATTPEDSALKTKAVADAENVAFQLRELSESVQDLRARADKDIEAAVVEVNESLEKLQRLNEAITVAGVTGQSTADLEDERRVELEKLAENIDIDYFINSDNKLQIYAGARPLLDSNPHFLSYTSATAIDSTVTYPGGFSAITANGMDITPLIQGGEIGALIELRDVSLVQEQAKLDEMATALMNQLNGLLNQGAALPPRPEMIGDVTGLAAGDAFTGTGSVRIATTDQNGVVQNFSDFNLAGYATIGDVVADINATLGPDVTASITADGELQIVANNAGEGISINELDSAVNPDGDGFSAYFGLNGLFDGTGAEDIQVSAYLKENAEYLAASRLSDDVALAIGDIGVNVGDGSLAKELNEAFTASYSFSAAGNFVAQTESINKYADKIMADIASRASNAASAAENTVALLERSKNNLLNLTGVNIDEEMAHIVDLEAKYDSAATLIGTIQEMFDELIAAVR